MKTPCVIITLFLYVIIYSMTAFAFEYESDRVAMSLDGYLEGNGIYALKGRTPDEDPSYTLGLGCKSTLGSWGAFKLALQGVYDGKVFAAHNDRLFNEFDKVYQDKNPYINVDEAYIDIYTEKMDLRLGIQKFAWGRLDEINPTDNMNTEDFTEGTMRKENERKIGAPSIKANIYTDLANVEIGWIPRYVPYRLPTPEERWFPPVLKAPSVIPTNTSIGDIPVTAIYKDIDLPAFTIGNSEIGVRISGYIGGWDLSLSYFSGYDPMPVTASPTELIVELENLLPLKANVMTQVYVEPRIHRFQVFGFDFSTTYGPLTIRGEWAYFDGKYYVRKTEDILREEMTMEKQQAIMTEFLREFLASGGTKTRQTFYFEPQMELQKDSMKYGIGIDYIHGDTTVSLQCIQECILDYDKAKSVHFNKEGLDTTFTLDIRRFFIQNTLEIDLAGAYNIEFQDILVKPLLTYSFTDNIHGTLGAILLDGKYDDSLIGQFKDNDEIFAKIRYSF
ncbi:MAG: hypothetical protein J7L53_02025 [Deltaproteobacteria bacterium]|nr:hypothetical protein [Deltaproteobacteria bacterium]